MNPAVTAPIPLWNTYFEQLISLQCIGRVPLGGPATRVEANFGGQQLQIQQSMDGCEGFKVRLCPESRHISPTHSTNPSVSSVFWQFGTAAIAMTQGSLLQMKVFVVAVVHMRINACLNLFKKKTQRESINRNQILFIYIFSSNRPTGPIRS